MRKEQFILVCIAFFVFLGAFIFALNSPLYHEKQAAEREMAREYLVTYYFLLPFEDREMIMKDYGLTEGDLQYGLTEGDLHREETIPRNILLDKNPIVKWLLGLRWYFIYHPALYPPYKIHPPYR